MRSMGLSWLFTAVFASVLCAGEWNPPASHPDSSSWDDLFAKEFSNAIAPEGVWAWKDGMLTASKDECVWSKKLYDRYILDLEFQTQAGSNSGVLFHCFDLANWIPNTLEIQITDTFGEPPHYQTCGAIYAHVAPKKQMVKEPGQWNRLTVTRDGPLVDVLLNGERVADMDMQRWTSNVKNPDGTDIPKELSRPLAEFPPKGHIGIQGFHGKSPTYYRNIKIKELE